MITVAKKYDNNHSYFYDEREQAEGPITKINVALPIAIYRNGKYVSPPTKYCFINTIEQEINLNGNVDIYDEKYHNLYFKIDELILKIKNF